MYNECMENGVEIGFRKESLGFVVVFKRRLTENDGINVENDGIKNKKEKIIILIKNNPNITIEEISNNLSISSRTVERTINLLKKANKLKRVGSKKNGNWEII